METNVLQAIKNIVENPISELKGYYTATNRANSMGGALEEYVKDIFANTITENDEALRLETLLKVFSYTGNQNNPPDSIVRGGDAIEVKKIENRAATLALNSSYPKAKLFSNSTMITDACRKCELWNEKDILYVVGVVPKENGKEGKRLTILSFVYGIDYAASAGVYERIKDVISSGIVSIPDVEFSQTNELGRVNRVDPLGITYLRVRGMWGIENPLKTFSYVYNTKTTAEFEFVAIINDEKYYSFDAADRIILEEFTHSKKNFTITDVKIKTPDNPINLRPAKLISYYR